jgi:hypothetical protein
VFLGIAAANALGLMLCFAVSSLWPADANASTFLNVINYPNLVLVSLCMGFAAGWIWRPLKLKLGWAILNSFLCTAAGVGLAFLFLHEGVICIIILSPLLFCGVLSGALIARMVLNGRNDRLNVLIAPAFALIVLVEPALQSQPVEKVIQDELVIAAPPSKVWPHLLSFSEIPATPRYWLFKLGLPYPAATTNGGNFVGADRACEFSGRATFKEKIRDFVSERLLTFEIVEMPPDPELMGHLDAKRGQFELHDNGNGSTTLIGRTWYTLHVRPGWYFDWWTGSIFRAVHMRVMENIRRLAESTKTTP